MDDLICLKNDEAVTTSLIVSEKFRKRHDLVLRDIRNLDCSEEFRLRNFEESSYKNEQNKRQPMFYLTKDGFMFLVMGYRGKKAANIKELYIKAFNSMEALLRERSTSIWIETRQKGKLTRKSETAAIKDFVDYAVRKGSEHADRYYILFSNLADKLSGIKPKHRDTASTHQLNNLEVYENIILNVIRDEVKQDIPYKQIYKDCKSRCEQAKDIAMLRED